MKSLIQLLSKNSFNKASIQVVSSYDKTSGQKPGDKSKNGKADNHVSS